MRTLILILLISISSKAQTLDGRGSVGAASFHWRQLSGDAVLQNPDSVVCNVDSLKTGVYEFELTCTNEFGESKDSVLIEVYGVTITSAVYKPTMLTWTVTNSSGIWYYLIEKVRNSKTSQVTKYYPKGGSKYVYRQAKTVYTYKYQITPVFKNGSKGVTVQFK